MRSGACHPGRARGTVHLCVGNAGAGFYDNGFQERPAWVEHEVGAGAGVTFGAGEAGEWVGATCWLAGMGQAALWCAAG